MSIIDERIAQAGRIIVPVAVLCGDSSWGSACYCQWNLPVRTLVEATNRIRRNELDFSVPGKPADEVGPSEAFNETLVGLRERQRSQIAIERYMSPQVYQLIQQHRLELGGTTRPITVIKSDIRDFTMLSGTMDAPTLVEFLNRYFRRMVTAITKYGGEVDKFMGDSILAKFGATEPDAAHPVHAVLAMIEMLEQCERLNHELRREGLPTIGWDWSEPEKR